MQLFCGCGEQGIEKKEVSEALQTGKLLRRGYSSVLIILTYVFLMYVCTEEEFSYRMGRRKILQSQVLESKIRVRVQDCNPS